MHSTLTQPSPRFHALAVLFGDAFLRLYATPGVQARAIVVPTHNVAAADLLMEAIIAHELPAVWRSVAEPRNIRAEAQLRFLTYDQYVRRHDDLALLRAIKAIGQQKDEATIWT